MNRQMLELIRLLCMLQIMILFILTVLELNMFLKKLKNLSETKTKTNTFRTQANHSVICGFFCIRFIDFMLAGSILIDYTSLFSPYDFEKNDNIILSYFKNE